ncbi:MAG TPA: hypothetical protein VFL79_19635 [Terriglobia bacterium]|nr:hypothetical protein [Terriglobia bacterium]
MTEVRDRLGNVIANGDLVAVVAPVGVMAGRVIDVKQSVMTPETNGQALGVVTVMVPVQFYFNPNLAVASIPVMRAREKDVEYHEAEPVKESMPRKAS